MKTKKYEIIGQFLDEIDYPFDEIEFKKESVEDFFDIYEPYNLFDGNSYERVVKYSDLISFKCRRELESFFEYKKDIQSLIIVFDCQSGNPVIFTFLISRLLKCYVFLVDFMPNTRVSIYCPDKNEQEIIILQQKQRERR